MGAPRILEMEPHRRIRLLWIQFLERKDFDFAYVNELQLLWYAFLKTLIKFNSMLSLYKVFKSSKRVDLVEISLDVFLNLILLWRSLDVFLRWPVIEKKLKWVGFCIGLGKGVSNGTMVSVLPVEFWEE